MNELLSKMWTIYLNRQKYSQTKMFLIQRQIKANRLLIRPKTIEVKPSTVITTAILDERDGFFSFYVI